MTTHGAQRNNRPQLVEDLDALIVSRSLRPAKVKLGGRLWTIKRDFTAEQIVQFWIYAENQETYGQAFSMIVGEKDGPDFAEMIRPLPVETVTPALRRLYQRCGILKRLEEDAEEPGDGGDEGESSASSQES